jgi:hypothetical protein
MLPMTGKLVSWTTFGAIAVAMVPFAAHPTVRTGASTTDIASRSMYAMELVGVSPVPKCLNCNAENREEYFDDYAIDKNTACVPEKPYRLFVRLNTKILCDNGGYWLCDDASSSTCTTWKERKPCPSNTCDRLR